MPDIVDDFLTRLTQHLPDAPLAVKLTLERELRQTWGGAALGKDTFVQKGIRGFGKETRAMLVKNALQTRKPWPQICQDVGISKATFLRMGNKKDR